MSKRQGKQALQSEVRHWISIGVFVCLFSLLLVKILSFDSQKISFLQKESEKRTVRKIFLTHKRGDIIDRNNKPLSISTKVYTVYVDPYFYKNTVDNANILSRYLGIKSESIINKISQRKNSRYVVISHNVVPMAADAIKDKNIMGIYLERRFKRFYPYSEVTGQLIGYTSNDEQSTTGIEGLELSFDSWLKPTKTIKKAVVDARGKVIKEIEKIQPGSVGKNIKLSIDFRIQEIAYIALREQVRSARAKRGTILVVNPNNGEILALAGYPSFNPNNRTGLAYKNVRNRAFTESFEPGSIIKPLTISAALSSGYFKADSIIDTGKSRFFAIGKHKISDSRSHGLIGIDQVIAKSSNIGSAKIGIRVGEEKMFSLFRKLALDGNTGSYFPGEVDGSIPYGSISKVGLAALSYGYGLNVTVAQIARAYSAIANGGFLVPLTLIVKNDDVLKERVMPEEITKQVRDFMVLVTQKGGTGQRAAIDGYKVAGKTGTVHKYIDGFYSRSSYRSLFAGMAPADNPELVAVVMVDEPNENRYYGGEAAAPVFSKVIERSLRILHIEPEA